MSDVKKEVKDTAPKLIDAYTKSGIIGKFLLAFLLMFVINIGVQVWSNFQNYDVLKTIMSQKEITKKVKKQIDISEAEFTRLKGKVGEVLQKGQIAFPNDLNIAFGEYGKSKNHILDCLLFPENY